MADYVLSAKAVMDASGFTSGLSSLQGGLGGLVGKFAAGNIAAQAFGAVMDSVSGSIGSAVKRVDTMNNFPKVMSNMGISADASQASINRLSEGIDGLPTALDDAVSSVQRFTSKNGDIEKSTSTFLAVNDAIAAGGAPAEQQASALEQLSQSYAKGRMDMMEWRSLQQAMPAQLNQVAKAMNMSTDEMGEGLRKGDLSMDEFIDKIIELDEKGGEGFASFQEQARSATGGIETAMTNVQNRVNKAVASIIDEIGGENIAAAINGVSSHFKDMAAPAVEFISQFKGAFDGAGLEDRVPALSDALGGLKDAAIDAFGGMGELLGNLATVGLPVLADLTTGAVNLAAMISNAAAEFLDDVNYMFDRSSILESQFQDTLKSINEQAGKLEFFTGVIEDLTAKEELNETEQIRLRAAVEGYNSTTGDSVEITNAAKGELSKSTEEIKKNADAWMDNAYAQAYAQQVSRLAEENVKLEEDLAEKTYKLTEAQEKFNAIYESGPFEEVSQELAQSAAYISKLEGEIDSDTEAIKKNNEAMNNYAAKAEVANQSLMHFIETHADLLMAVQSSGLTVEEFTGYLDEMGISEEQVADMSYDARQAMVDMASKAKQLGEEVGLSAADMSRAFSDAGISLDDLAEVSAADFKAMWAECNGDVGRMKGKLAEYNAVKLQEKKAKVTDNGTAAETNRKIDGVKDNIKSIPNKTVELKATDSISSVVNTVKAKLSEVKGASVSISAGGKFAAGTFAIPRHADGGIFDRPTMTSIGLVAEAGAEALIPLTNRYYMGQFTSAIAEGLSDVMGGDTYHITLNPDASQDANALVLEIAEAVRAQRALRGGRTARFDVRSI